MSRWWKTRRRGLQQLSDAAIYFPGQAALRGIGLLPGPVRARLLAGLGRAAHACDRKRVQTIHENLVAAFPDMGAEERHAIARGIYRHFALLIDDTVRFRRLRTPEARGGFAALQEDCVLQELVAAGRPAIVVTGHLGNWEVAAAAASDVVQLHAVAHRPRNPHIARNLERMRSLTGHRILYTDEGIAPIRACLERGEWVAMLPDKHLNSNRVPVEFFGRWVKAPSAPASLAYRTGAPILPAAGFRTDGSPRFSVEHDELIEPDRTAGFRDELRRLTQAYMTGLERLIRRHPEQWIWFHRRWKKVLGPDERDMRPHHGQWRGGAGRRMHVAEASPEDA